MKLSRYQRVAALVAIVVLGLFLFRPGVSRLRNRIAVSIGNAVGRRVSIDSVHLHILPRPGFDLEGLTIYDDPEFNAEPLISAGYVSAAIRVRSLFRGRLDIASLSANYPSINLVRNEQGRWNFTGLLEHNAQIPAAPTDRRAFERRPVLPYLEASHARVNFKVGAIKKSYALMDADLAFWQDAENSWSARIKAAPVRTDFNLTDTGIVTIDGTWQRAPSLQSTPMQFSLQWQNGQLGQITKLFSGNDRGWRGAVTFSAKVSGTPDALAMQSDIRIDAFHRYDIAVRDEIRLAAKCGAQYKVSTGTVSDLLCESPAGTGKVRISGSVGAVAGMMRNPIYDLTLAAEDIPSASVLRLLRQSKRYVPAELTPSGAFNAEFHAARLVSSSQRGTSARVIQTCNGTGTATKVGLSSPRPSPRGSAVSASNQIALSTIPFELSGCNEDARARVKGITATPGLRIGPVTLAINSSAPLTLVGSISADGYQFFLRGDSTLRDVFSLEDMLGIPGTRPTAEGLAKLDVGVMGRWQGFSAPIPSGGAQLRNVHAQVRWMTAPLEIESATALIEADALTLQKIAARIGTAHFAGRVRVARHCTPVVPSATSSGDTPEPTSAKCPVQFDLSADNLSKADLTEWFSQRLTKRPWYQVLEASPENATSAPVDDSPLLRMGAEGNLRVARFSVDRLSMTRVSSTLELQQGRLSLTALSGELLQGTHHGNWVIDFTSPANASGPQFRGTGTLTNISLDQLSSAMNDSWISGAADGTYFFSGPDVRDMLRNSEAKLKFVMRDGSLLHIDLFDTAQPMRVERFSGELNLNSGQWRLTDATLESQASTYKVRGVAASTSDLNFSFKNDDERSWSITGSLAEPRIARTGISVPEVKRTEADVKPPTSQVQ